MPGEPCELETVALVPHQVPQAGVAQSLGIIATHTLACNGRFPQSHHSHRLTTVKVFQQYVGKL